ncbi:MAG: hypothetical protein E7589_07290 [Ruminococcaceae bacterium]|nr:hypothetical protein [Oscillospiraceae bacterium]
MKIKEFDGLALEYEDIAAYGDGFRELHKVSISGRLGQRINIAADFYGAAFVMATWGNRGVDVTVSLYKWQESLDKTVGTAPILSERYENVADNGVVGVYSEIPVAAGEYLLLASDATGIIAPYFNSSNAVSKGYTYIGDDEFISDLWVRVRFAGKAPEVPFLKCEGLVVDKIDGTHTPLAEYEIPADSLVYTHEVMPDTWVFTDGLGRRSLTHDDVGSPREDKTVAMFYWDWHLRYNGAKDAFNIQDFIAEHPEAQNDPKHPGWDDSRLYYWNQPVFGYYQTPDRYVLRRHAEMLANAGVDAIFMDNSNHIYAFREGYTPLYEEWIDAMESGGVRSPKVSYHLPMWRSEKNTPAQIEFFYLDLYRSGKFHKLWYYLDGKPMLIGFGHFLDTENNIMHKEMQNFFTFRPGVSPYDDHLRRTPVERASCWGWSARTPQTLYYRDKEAWERGEVEQTTVSVACNFDINWQGMSAMNGFTVTGRSYTTDYFDRYKKEGREATKHGYHFSEQLELALKNDPKVMFITGWNEWTVSRHDNWCGIDNAFADQFIDEFSRDIEPTRGPLKDHYYYLLVNSVRRYKGARPIPLPSGKKAIDICGGEEQWQDVKPYFAAYIGKTKHRDSYGRVGMERYVDESGRNDIIGAQVARDDEYLYFRAECADNITSVTDKLWMNLYIDTDGEYNGWESFNFVVRPSDGGALALERFTGNGYKSEKVADVEHCLDGKSLTVKIPKSSLGLGNKFTVNFAWTDNVHDLGDTERFTGEILEFYTSGCVAPGGRFKYSYIVE